MDENFKSRPELGAPEDLPTREPDGSGSPPRAVQLAPGDTIGRYVILEKLGDGGFGSVYKAEQRSPVRRTVALKLIKPGFDTSEIVARFDNERQALSRMEHPHIARVLDAGSDERGRPFFVMEYVAGRPITQFADENRLSIRQRLELFTQVCQAIGHAHSKAVIHRDIKATNVLASMVDGRPVAKVIDFGIAKALTSDRLTDLTFNTAQGLVIGTYESMSPEQAAGSSDIDTRTDVYSLGVLLYELLAGLHPFRDSIRAKMELEVRRIIRDDEPARPSTKLTTAGESADLIAKVRQTRAHDLARQLSRELEWIPLKAMRKERDRRYATTAQLADDIGNYLGGRALIAGPESRLYVAGKFLKRHRLALGVATSFVIALGGLTAVALVQRAAAVTGRAEAEQQRHRAEVSAQNATGSAREAMAKTQLAEERAQAEAAALKLLGRTQYFASIGAAAAAIAGDEVSNARRFLLDTPPALRDWEWNFLMAESDRSVAVIGIGPGGRAISDLSPDESRIVVRVGNDVLLWDVLGNKSVATLHDQAFVRVSVGVQFSDDSKWVALVCGSGVVHVWRASDGRELAKLSPRDKEIKLMRVIGSGSIVCVSGVFCDQVDIWESAGWTQSGMAKAEVHQARRDGPELLPFECPVADVSADGGLLLASEVGQGEIMVCDTKSGRTIATLAGAQQVGHQGLARQVAFCGDGTRVLGVSFEEHWAGVWEAATGRQIAKVDIGTADRVIVNRDGSLVAMSNTEGVVSAAEVESGRRLFDLAIGKRRVAAVMFAGDSECLAVCEVSGVVSLLDPRTAVRRARLRGSTEPVAHVGMQQGRLITRSVGGIVRKWDLEAAAHDLNRRAEHRGRVLDVSADGSRMVTLGEGGAAVWDVQTGRQISALEDSMGVTDAWTSRTGDVVLASEPGWSIRAWDAATGKIKSVMAETGRQLTLRAVSGDGGQAVSVSPDVEVNLWDVASARVMATASPSWGGLLRQLREPVYDPGAAVALGPEDELIAMGLQNGELKIWSRRDGSTRQLRAGDRKRVYRQLAMSPDGKRLLALLEDGGLWLIDTAASTANPAAPSGDGVCLVEPGKGNRLGVFSPDGRFVLASTLDRTVRVWTATSGEVVSELVGHSGDVLGGAFSADGSRVVTWSNDATVRLWATGEGRQLLVMPEADAGSLVKRAAFSNDGLRLIAVRVNGSVAVWDATSPGSFKHRPAGVR